MNTSRETLKILAGVHSPNCISIYINAGDLGAPISGTQSKITFKNKLAEAGEDLASRGTDQSEIDRILGPGHELLEDGGFWEGLDPGLAVFLCDGKLNTLGLHKPVHCRSFVHSPIDTRAAKGVTLFPAQPEPWRRRPICR